MSVQRVAIRRLFAFLFDIFLFTMPFQIAGLLIDPDAYLTFTASLYGLPAAMLKVVAALPPMALCTKRFGATPGKWLLGLRVGLPENAGFTLVFKRTLLAFVVGAGAEIGFFSWIMYYFSFRTLTTTGETLWDKVFRTSVHAQRIRGGRVALFVLIFFVGSTLAALPLTYDYIVQSYWRLYSPTVGTVSLKSGSMVATGGDFTLKAETGDRSLDVHANGQTFMLDTPLSGVDRLTLVLKPGVFPELPGGLTARLRIDGAPDTPLSFDVSILVSGVDDGGSAELSLTLTVVDRYQGRVLVSEPFALSADPSAPIVDARVSVPDTPAPQAVGA